MYNRAVIVEYVKSIAVILPAYNEEQTIEKTIEDFCKAIPAEYTFIINNCSNDATKEIALSTLSRLGCKGRIINERCPGKGNAVRSAFMNIEADIYVLADADSTYPAAQVNELVEPVIAREADMVVGDRQSAGCYAAENK